MKKILPAFLFATLPWTIPAYAEDVIQFVDTDVDASGNLHFQYANTSQAIFYDEKRVG